MILRTINGGATKPVNPKGIRKGLTPELAQISQGFRLSVNSIISTEDSERLYSASRNQCSETDAQNVASVTIGRENASKK